MNRLLIKQPLNIKVSKEECIEDLACLFHELKESYGMYDYFGEEKFETAFQNIIDHLDNETNFEFEKTIHNLKNELDFIKDGHFSLEIVKKRALNMITLFVIHIIKGFLILIVRSFIPTTNPKENNWRFLLRKVLNISMMSR